MAYRDRLRPRFRRPMPAAFKRLSDRFRWFGMDQTGSVLAAGVVVLGIFAVLFAAGVQREGAAQELDIFTAHRRKALDVARGGIDKLLMEFKQKDSVSDCYSGVTSNDEENWELASNAIQMDSNTVLLTSEATVAGVTETVKVTLKRQEGEGGNVFQNFLGGITLAARNKISGHASRKPDVEQPVYYGEDNCYLTYRSGIIFGKTKIYDLQKTTKEMHIPTPEDLDYAIRTQLTQMRDNGEFVEVNELTHKWNTTIKKNTWITTKAGKGTIKPWGFLSELKVEKDQWLVIEGSLDIWGAFFTLNLQGNVVVLGGSVRIGGLLFTKMEGAGMIICLPDSPTDGITLGQIGLERLEALTLMTTGNLDLGSLGSFKGGLLGYGKKIKADSAGQFKLTTCCLVSDTDIEVSAGGEFYLRKGKIQDWANQPLPKVLGPGSHGPYEIVDWQEGNG